MMDSRTKTKHIRIFRLNPDNFSSNVWGGTWLPRWKKIKAKKNSPVGESWEFSLHPHFPSQILLRDNKWVPVTQLLKKSPFLLKFIDARENLSLQVHPNDDYARRHENDSGKAESWVILSSSRQASSGFIYLGFRNDLPALHKKSHTLKKVFQQALQNQTSTQPLLRLLNKIKVKPGDVFYLPPGTVHAIGAGVRLFEIQQTSNVTYRVWDWNRTPPRPLHLEKAMDVIQFKAEAPKKFRPKSNLIKANGSGSFVVKEILKDHRQRFTVQQIDMKKGSIVNQSVEKKFYVLTVIVGVIEIPGWGLIKEGTSVFVAADERDYQLKAISPHARVFKSFVP